MSKAAELATMFVNKQSDKEFKQSFEIVKPTEMNPFRGMFGHSKLTEEEESSLKNILESNKNEKSIDLDSDLDLLRNITAEIKSISNQSILLHGERIKKAQSILRSYKDNAFTMWLISTYGNRQTPYNMLQYYDFYHSLPLEKRCLLERIPKRAAYTLASREGEMALKLDIIEGYKIGQKQAEVLNLIYDFFPLSDKDKRRMPSHFTLLDDLEHLAKKLQKKKDVLTNTDKARIGHLLFTLKDIIA